MRVKKIIIIITANFYNSLETDLNTSLYIRARTDLCPFTP